MSTDFNGFLVDQLYSFFLGREADEGGRAFWIGRLEAGASVAELETAFARSDEARKRGFVGPPDPEAEQRTASPIADADGTGLLVGDVVTFLGTDTSAVVNGLRPDAVGLSRLDSSFILVDDGQLDTVRIAAPDAFDFA